MKPSRWIEAGVVPVTTGLLVVTWLNAWLQWLMHRASVAGELAPTLPPLLMMVTLGLSALSARWILRHTRPAENDRTRQALARDPGPVARQQLLQATGLGVALVLLLTYGLQFPFGFFVGLFAWGQFISPQFITLIAILYLWWRGLTLGQSRTPYAEIEQTFYNGLGALALLLIANRLSEHLPSSALFSTVLAFFGLGLSALTLASFERARHQHHAATGAHLALTRPWLSTVGGIIFSVLAGGVGIVALFAPETLARFQPLWALVDLIAKPLLLALIIVLGWIIEPLLTFLSQLIKFSFENLRIPQAPPQFQVTEETMKVLDAVLNSPAAQISSRAVVIVITLLVLLALIAEALRRYRGLAPVEAEEVRESVLSRALLWKQLKDLFARRPRSERLPFYLPLLGRADDPRVRVRRAYRGMLEWARGRGLARPTGHTPATYAAWLAQSHPTQHTALTTLTQLYHRARYATEPLSEADAQQAQSALEQITTPSHPS